MLSLVFINFKESDTVACLCSWLVAMMDAAEHAKFLEDHGKSPWRYSRQVLDDVIDVYVRCKWGSVLVTGLDIFQQVHSLNLYNFFLKKKDLHIVIFTASVLLMLLSLMLAFLRAI